MPGRHFSAWVIAFLSSELQGWLISYVIFFYELFTTNYFLRTIYYELFTSNYLLYNICHFSAWLIAFLSSELQGWLISSVIFSIMYRREKAALQVNLIWSIWKWFGIFELDLEYLIHELEFSILSLRYSSKICNLLQKLFSEKIYILHYFNIHILNDLIKKNIRCWPLVRNLHLSNKMNMFIYMVHWI